MSQKAYLNILKTGVYLSLLSFFLVFKTLIFPYITSKQISFNILIEVLFIFWIGLVVKYPNLRPKKSWISLGLVSFFAVLTLSSFTGVDFNLSFWGDAERMLGVFHLLHFLAYYFIVITVMKTWTDWRNFFTASVGAATLLVLYAWIKDLPFSTFGNTAYLSAYVIFNIYFALILFFREKAQHAKISDNWLMTLYLAAAGIMLSVFSLTHTRGAYVGIGLSALFLLTYFLFTAKSKKIKLISAVVIVVMVGIVALAFLKPELPLVSNSRIMSTVRQITPQTNTFQTRFIAWKAAWQDLPNHWLLGTGHGTFAITFDKYFDPIFYNYTRTETYFDRAHNTIVEITSTAGVLGIFTYLSILLAVLYYLWQGYRRRTIGRYDFVLLTALIIAYFVQNLAAFDSLASYISLMMLLGFIYWLSQAGAESDYVKNQPFNGQEMVALGITGVIMIFVFYQYNFLPLKMMRATILGELGFELNEPAGAWQFYQEALSYNTPLDRESRDNFARSLTHQSYILNDLSDEERRRIFDYAIEMVNKNIAYNPKDHLMHVELAQLANVAARFDKKDQAVFDRYSNIALEAINKANEYGPRHIKPYFIKGQIYEARGDFDSAIATLEYVTTLNNDYYDSFCRLAWYYFRTQREDSARQSMNRCLDLGGAYTLEQADFVRNLAGYYWSLEDWPRTLLLYERLSNFDSSAEVQVGLAKLYLQAGQIDKSIAAAQKAIELNPEKYQELASDFIQKVKDNNYQEFLPQEKGESTAGEGKEKE